MNPHRSPQSNQGYPSQVIFRHGTPVLSFSEDITRAMRGHAKRLSRNYRRRNWGNVIYICFNFISDSRDVLCTLSRHHFVQPEFRLFCARLPVYYLAVYSVLGSLIKQSLTETATSTVAV